MEHILRGCVCTLSWKSVSSHQCAPLSSGLTFSNSLCRLHVQNSGEYLQRLDWRILLHVLLGSLLQSQATMPRSQPRWAILGIQLPISPNVPRPSSFVDKEHLTQLFQDYLTVYYLRHGTTGYSNRSGSELKFCNEYLRSGAMYKS